MSFLFLFFFLLAVFLLFFRRFLRFFLVGFLLRWQFVVVDRVVAAEFVDEPLYNLQLSLAALAHHLGVESHGACDQWIVVFAEAFLELVDVVEGIAVDTQALVETADAQILLGELVIGQPG